MIKSSYACHFIVVSFLVKDDLIMSKHSRFLSKSLAVQKTSQVKCDKRERERKLTCGRAKEVEE